MKTPLAILAESKVPLLLVGGTAVQIYGFGRNTKDFDCLVAVESDPALAAELAAAGFEEFRRNELVVRYRHRNNPLWVLDTLLASAATFEKMWAARREKPFAGFTLHLAAPLHIAAMKLHAMKNNPERELHDLLDVLDLLKRDRGQWTEAELKAICERYGPPDCFDLIRRHLDP